MAGGEMEKKMHLPAEFPTLPQPENVLIFIDGTQV